MISVDNFYWALYENLLKPVGLDCWYYYPWGTKNFLSKNEWKPYSSQSDLNHVLFHFDQEPLWENSLGTAYELGSGMHAAWSALKVKLLANSEHSTIKNNMCRDRHMLDWYFFYHGFAALDWYRDAQYIHSQHPIQHAFVSLNHITTEHRSYRISMLARLIKLDIAHLGQISFHADLDSIMKELHNPNSMLSAASANLAAEIITQDLKLPWSVDSVPIDGNLSARFGASEYRLWQQSLVHLVNETVFYAPKLHLTEKIFKPIVAGRPFILAAAPGNLAYLRSYGFQTFDKWIDESYDTITDPDCRLDAIANQLAQIAKLSQPALQELYAEMRPVLEFNRNHFFNDFKHRIVAELVDNFDGCIRIWNNGRVDDRSIAVHPDLDRVKKILMQ